MKSSTAILSVLLLAGFVRAGDVAGTATKVVTPEALQADIAALKPTEHVWRAIPWKTCPLDALKASREQHKPIITWVFLGTPADERC